MTSPAAIIVRFSEAGLHEWRGATGRRAYLGSTHRHQFFVEARLEVRHDDRELEFHDVLTVAKKHFLELAHGYRGELPNFGSQSCERLARGLGSALSRVFPERQVVVAVYEDNEVGAEVRVGSDHPDQSR